MRAYIGIGKHWEYSTALGRGSSFPLAALKDPPKLYVFVEFHLVRMFAKTEIFLDCPHGCKVLSSGQGPHLYGF